MNSQNLSIIALMTCVLFGCARSPDRQAQATSVKQPQLAKMQQAGSSATVEMRLADHHEWLMRLLSTPPVEGIQQVSANSGQMIQLPVPLSQSKATDGKRFTLVVDNRAGLVWLHSSGGISPSELMQGPWKIDQPDAAHLLHSISTPPPTTAMTQGRSTGSGHPGNGS